MGLITTASGSLWVLWEEKRSSGWVLDEPPSSASGDTAPFPGSPLRVQTGAELKGFHTYRAKDSGRSSSCCVPGCRMPAAGDPAFLLPCCLFDPFASPFGDPKSLLLCQPTQRAQRHQDEGHNHALVSREEQGGFSFPAGQASIGMSH